MTKKNGDPRAASITIELDRPRVMRVDMNVLGDIEEILDVSLFQMAGQSEAAEGLFANLTIRKLRDITWAMLREDDPELSKEDVGRILSPADFPRILDAFSKLFERAMPEATEGPLAGKKGKQKADD